MPRERSALKPLTIRKQMLLLESDLNRARLVEALGEWQEAFHHSKEHLARLGSLASTAARLTATFSTAKRLFSRPADGGKKSWMATLFEGVTTGASLWSLLRSRQRNPDA
jgi:hypothetical protein